MTGLRVRASAPGEAAVPEALTVTAAGVLDATAATARLASRAGGLTEAEAARRLRAYGPNAVRSHRARAWAVLGRQLRSPLLVLLLGTACASFFLGERGDAVIIGAILAASVGLGFGNEYRAERAAESLHARVRHRCVVHRGGRPVSIDVTDLVPGDVVEIRLGEVVPADLRLLDVTGLECVESVLTGESLPVAKSTAPVPPGTPSAELTCCALMGTVVHAGSGRGVVVATGGRAEFGRVAVALGEHRPETEFQIGLRRFSMLLVRVAAVLTGAIFAINLVLHRPLLDALLFSLAIAVGISPQLLPAVVSTSLAAGSRRLARRKVLVKRLVCIEDLGDVEVLFTDKTGTLTEGRIALLHAAGADGHTSDTPLLLGMLCNEATVDDGRATGGNPLDTAIWDAPASAALRARAGTYRRVAALPFDHERQLASVLVEDADGNRRVITKGAPEVLLARCADVPDALRAALDAEFAAGNRVIAVASRAVPAAHAALTPDDEHDLAPDGLLVFSDPPKPSARTALDRLAGLGITVKVLTGDNPVVAAKVCADLGLPVTRVVTGADVDAADDARLAELIATATVFARVGPEHKARIVAAQRRTGVDVAFLGDGVNDAVALHAADVGISVESGTDVAKDAADVVLLEKDLNVLADGVTEGRRIFANTMKYVLMGTSSNFGNMFSAAGASLFLPFLPMLPSQLLLNNLLYDASQLAIPTDTVDPERLARPARWDVPFIRRFMTFFGPISSLFDFATFGLLLWGFHAGPTLFRTGWFVESLATQTLVIFAVRTRRIPFFRSRPSVPLLLSVFGAVGAGVLLPVLPFARDLGFRPLPGTLLLLLVPLLAVYFVLIEIGKRVFYRAAARPVPATRPRRTGYRVHRRAARFTR
ncbi:Magnesium-transporting ATPase, P-type 1 [Actinomadura rubteroloni]|uniref:Magnesium-transporting ATPase, P-type 1 n=1 Tax=Actinomadura rubteroloni TaxID=1926885 RepID=A0A2P4UEW4_9ACTN|nr:magnesium-translocating P-type ATPase [Actinomadura rubteroloni]POM23558.1 Magnesium-transporting ATPase, P-type 1 [Actinomadura rubteroloni]